ncbi:MAG: hypothetical protein ACREF4_20870, partial [Gammaproteobacteria bacterium]
MHARNGDRRLLYPGLAIVTASTLLLEIVFTRVFSVVMYYHFAFLAISLALFGLGTAGVYVYLRPAAVQGDRLGRALVIYAVLAAGSTIFGLWVVLGQRVSLTIAGENILALTKIYLSVALPFLFSGMCVTTIINRFSTDMSRLYFWDLAGAAVGCLALVLTLGWLGGIGTVLLSAVLFAVAGVLFAASARQTTNGARASSAPLVFATLGLVAIVGVAAYDHARPFLKIPSVKGTREDRVAFARWNTFSRITVEKLDTDFYWLKMDSSAATRIFSAEVARQGFEPTRRFTETR